MLKSLLFRTKRPNFHSLKSPFLHKLRLYIAGYALIAAVNEVKIVKRIPIIYLGTERVVWTRIPALK